MGSKAVVDHGLADEQYAVLYGAQPPDDEPTSPTRNQRPVTNENASLFGDTPPSSIDILSTFTIRAPLDDPEDADLRERAPESRSAVVVAAIQRVVSTVVRHPAWAIAIVVVGAAVATQLITSSPDTSDPATAITQVAEPLPAREVPLARSLRSASPAAETRVGCHPSYDPCIPDLGSDVDCEGTNGDGPRYSGQVTVNGVDEYGLDDDGDGQGCEG